MNKQLLKEFVVFALIGWLGWLSNFDENFSEIPVLIADIDGLLNKI